MSGDVETPGAAAPSALNYNRTVVACFVGYVTQAVINNFMPLLFVTFSTTLGIGMARLSALITVNFITQLVVDVLAGRFVDRIGYKPCILAAHASALAGLLVLGLLPTHVPGPYPAIVAAVFLYAIGGGLIEVMVSPIVEACPSGHKAKAMSLLHSFYCWGQLGTVLISTMFLFAFGAAEQGMSQWASAFAETGLGVAKVVGDLAGPAMFALMMGLSRTIYGIWGHRMNLSVFIAGSSVLCVAMYLAAALSPIPLAGLAACAVTGFSVGIMWPGTFSMAADAMPGGGTLMFALLAVAGDLGCAGGPAVVGFVASANGDDLRTGLLFGSLFAATLLACVIFRRRTARRGSVSR